MLNEIMFLQTAGFFRGGGFGEILNSWQQLGVFDYMIPFLLIFAIVYGILIQMKLFGGKADPTGRIVNAIIALAVGLMSLQFGFVSRFFSELFPRVGIGLVILLLFIIFTGLFSDYKSKAIIYTMYGIGAAVLIVVLALTANTAGTFSYLPVLGYNWINILPWIVLLALIGVVIGAGREKRQEGPETVFSKLLEGAAGSNR